MQVGERSRSIYPVALLRRTLSDAVGTATATEMYLTETKLTAVQARTHNLIQAATHSATLAQQLAHAIALQHASTVEAAQTLHAELWALSGELPPSDRQLLAEDAFAQATSLQDRARLVFTSCSNVPTRGGLRWSVQAALTRRSAYIANTGQNLTPSWREQAYVEQDSQPDGCSSEDALKMVLHLLAARPFDQSDSAQHAARINDVKVQKPPAELTLTALAALFSDMQSNRPEAVPLDVLIDAYEERAKYHPTPAVSLSDTTVLEGPELSMCTLLLLRNATALSDRRLVIAHSLLGDHRGYGRLWSSALQRSDVFAFRHRGLASGNTLALNHEGSMSLAGEYAEGLVAMCASRPFDLLGSSFGAVLASHVRRAASAAGGCPRQLILLDPPPAVPKELPVPKMLSSLRTAAMGVLLIHLQVEMGATVWEQFPQLMRLPEEALSCFVAAQWMAEGVSREAISIWEARFSGMIAVYRQCRYAFHSFSASIDAARVHPDGSPAVLMLLSHERWPTFREMFPGIKEDAVDRYGPAVTLQLLGKHIAMINRCIGNEDATFTSAVERFLGDRIGDAWWWVSNTAVKVQHEESTTWMRPPPAGLDVSALVPLMRSLGTTVPFAGGEALSSGASDGVEVSAAVQEVAHELLGARTSIDAPLMEVGIDSLGAVEFRTRLSRRLDDLELPTTLVFDFPTLRQIEAHVTPTTRVSPRGSAQTSGAEVQQLLSRLMFAGAGSQPNRLLPATNAPRQMPAEVCAADCKASGRVHDFKSAWNVGTAACDSVGTVPKGRWEGPVDSREAYGAYIQSIQLFDLRSFGIAPVEAELMDPHQRLALEGSYRALHSAGFERAALLGSTAGVFAGIWQSDYSIVLPRRGAASRGPFAVAAVGCNMLVGRLSYLLGLQGPSIPYDTACSSSLSAAHAALSALQRQEASPGIVLGVNLMCDSTVSKVFAAAQMTSPTGKSYTFDARADGYARGEACSCAIVQLESGSGCVRFEAGAVRQDGKSASLMAPNGMAQQALLRAALERAGRAASGAFLLEAHGTGTKLGDPIEARAMSAVRDDPQLVAVMGCKATFGHTEPGAGLMGILRLLMAVRLSAVAPNAQLRAMNPHVQAAMPEGRRSSLPVQLARPHALDEQFGGVSSFGLNGTIAHAVLAWTGFGGDSGRSGIGRACWYRRRALQWGDVDSSANHAANTRTYSVGWTASTATKMQSAHSEDTPSFLLVAASAQPMNRVEDCITRAAHLEQQARTEFGLEGGHIIRVKYAIIGAGQTGLQFLDRCLAKKAGTVGIVDAQKDIGGHWTQQYSFVKLHAPKATYGIDPSNWSGDVFKDLATRDEILSHYQRTARPLLQASGVHPLLGHRAERVMSQHLGPCVLCKPVGDGPPVLLVAESIVDATINAHPWNDPLTVNAAPGVPVVSPGGLKDFAIGAASSFAVIGGGKSACDAVLHLRRRLGVRPDAACDQLTWVFSTCLAFFRRRPEMNQDENFANLAALLQDHRRSPKTILAELPTYPVIFHHFTSALPTTTHHGILSEAEMSELRCQERFEGERVTSVTQSHIFLANRQVAIKPNTVIVTCTGPRVDESTGLSRVREQHAAFQHVQSVDDYDLDARTLFPLMTLYSVPQSNHLLAELLFSCSLPGIGLNLIKTRLRSILTGGPQIFFRGLENVLGNRKVLKELGLSDCFTCQVPRLPKPKPVMRIRYETTYRPRAVPQYVDRNRVATVILGGDALAAATQRGIRLLLTLTHKATTDWQGRAGVLLLTCGTLDGTSATGASEAAHGGAWGFARVLRLEHPTLGAHSADVVPGVSVVARAALSARLSEPEAAWRSTKCFAARLRACVATSSRSLTLTHGLHAITGGLGGLGLRAAVLLEEGGASRVLLSSRSGRVVRDGQGLEAQLRAVGVVATVVACDSADSCDLNELQSVNVVTAVLHTAGIGDKGLLLDLHAQRVGWMHGPKASGAWHLQCATLTTPLRSRVLFSSVGSGLGNVGQANYAAGNACLDALALSRRALGEVACSLQWPLIGGAGMGAAAFAAMGEPRVAIAGQASVSLEQYATCLGAQLITGVGSALSVQVVHRADAHEFLQDLADTAQPRFSEFITASHRVSITAPAASPAVGGALAHSLATLTHPTQRRAHVEATVLRVVHELTGTPVASLTAATPLMEAGVDSLSATELSTRLKALTGVALSPTLVFEQPTPRAVAEHLLEQAGPPAVTSSKVAISDAVLGTKTATSTTLACVLGRWPGGCKGGEPHHELLAASGDAIGSVPASRYVLKNMVDVGKLPPVQVACARHGGFVAGVQRFDARGFGISSAEAGVIDPQQRLLLELGYGALHAALHRRVTLMGGDTGVFLGIEHPDWVRAQSPSGKKSIFAVTGDNVSAAAGRTSFVLGMQGPCSTVDTACSSALVAMHWGSHALASCESGASLAFAVSLKLAPWMTLSNAAAGLLSVDGRCKTLDVRANGYARSESVGALVLRQGDDAIALKGSAVRQDGRSASLTAPNGSAQRVLLLAVLSRASLGPADIGTIEQHGTGTALGDPTEAGSTAAVQNMPRGIPLVISTVKSSVGHSEGGAGHCGLLRVWSVLEASMASGNTHLRVLNPLVGERFEWNGPRFALPTNASGHAGACGVSSFGYSGTIAHAAQSIDLRSSDCTASAPLSYRRVAFPLWPDRDSDELSTIGTYASAWCPLSGLAVGCCTKWLLVQAARRPSQTPTAAAPLTPANWDAHSCIVGAGTIGMIIARDSASCGYSSVVLEKERAIGGVWAVNNYPGLRLQTSGASYRCLSLVPAWMKEGEGKEDVCYRPTGQEVLQSLIEMADHELVDVQLNTTYLRYQRRGKMFVVSTSRGSITVRALVFAPGAHECTAGAPYWPINPTQVLNGACMIHSSQVSSSAEAFYSARKKHVIGSSKAAIDIIETLDPKDDGVVWAHRGHIIFHNRDHLHDVFRVAKPTPPSFIAQAHIGNLFLKNQQFAAAFDGLVKSGMGVCVGEPVAKHPALRGGVESEESMAYARKFINRQVIISALCVEKGALQICCEDGRVITVEPEDAAVFCTGQRSEGAGEGSYRRRAECNRDGLFHVAPYSNQTPTCALYMLRCLLSYLEGTPSAYTDGRVAAAFEKQAQHMEQIKDRGTWARFWANMGGVEYDIAPLIFDSDKFMAYGLEAHFRWYTHNEWYGKDVQVKPMLSMLATETPPTSIVSADAWSGVGLLLEGADTIAASQQDGIRMLLALIQAATTDAHPRLQIITSGAQEPTPALAAVSTNGAAHGGAWGIGRLVCLEHPQLRQQSVDASHGARSSTAPILLGSLTEAEVACRDSTGYASRLRRSKSSSTKSTGTACGVYVLTGGLGGLGLSAAVLLVERCAAVVRLASRSGRVAHEGQGLEAQLSLLAKDAVITTCDSADPRDVTALVGIDTVAGVLHAAGTGESGLLSALELCSVHRVFGSKAYGAWLLHCAATASPLESRILFSSAGGGFAYVGVSSYAAANAYIDSHARSGRGSGLAACSLQWARVGGAGGGAAVIAVLGDQQASMIAGQRAALSLKEYIMGFGMALLMRGGLALCVQAVHRSDVCELLRDLADASQLRFEELHRGSEAAAVALSSHAVSSAATDSHLANLAPAERQSHTEATVLRVVRELTGADTAALKAETPLMEAGIDSLAATELSSRLRALVGVALSPTLVFEQPTPRAVAMHMLEQMNCEVTAVSMASVVVRSVEATAPLAFTAMVVRSAGSCNDEVSRWRLQVTCGDAMGQVPATRWVLDDVVEDASELTPVQVACARHGGFLAGIQRFDARGFGISSAEAGVIDPQQRLLLELGYGALHAALHRRVTLMGGDTGVFLGIERPDWALAQPKEARSSVYAVTGDSVSAAAGRVSFVLGMQGPCTSLDTACASALTAVHWARHAVASSGAGAALGLATALKLLPHPTLGAASAGMLSVDGRCKTLDARANGYARSEGVGALVLAPCEQAWLVLRGSTVRQDGRSASLTAPNGSAQRTLLLQALGSTQLLPPEVACIEAHGTGTALGDPTEAGALTAVFVSQERAVPLAVGAAKASVGHSEAVSGQVGLLRARRVVDGQACAGNPQLRALNPLIGAHMHRSGMLLPTQAVVTNSTCGVSSFGYTGTIAHALASQVSLLEKLQPSTAANIGFRRRIFPWYQPPHPLAQRPLRSLEDTTALAIFRSPAAGALHAIAADHVAQGRVIFPGVGYLEMARASATSAMALRGVFFLQPLSLEAAGLLVECAVYAGRFEVRSDAGGDASMMHCSGECVASDGEWCLDNAALRAQSNAHAAHVGTLNDALDAVGLQYGPGYRTLEQAWRGPSFATTRLRARATHAGTHVHPADLDDALKANALIRSSGNGKIRLPFAVDKAQLPAGTPLASVPRAVVALDAADAVSAWLGALAGRAQQTQVDGFKLRTLQPRAPTSSDRIDTPWKPTPHPFLQARQSVLLSTFFRAQVTEVLYSLVEGHVAGRPQHAWFPVSGHLELVSAALRVERAVEEPHPVSLSVMHVLRPLLIDGQHSTQCIESELQQTGDFVVRFGLVKDGVLDEPDECFKGAAGTSDAPDGSSASTQCLTVTREMCTGRLDVTSWGLVGGSYRVYDEIWTSRNGHNFANIFERTLQTSCPDVAIHPADLHGLITIAVCLDYDGDGNPPLPFAIDGARLGYAPRHAAMKGCAEQLSTLRSSATMASAADGSEVAHLQNLVLRRMPASKGATLKLATLGQKHAYRVSWLDAPWGSTALVGVTLIAAAENRQVSNRSAPLRQGSLAAFIVLGTRTRDDNPSARLEALLVLLAELKEHSRLLVCTHCAQAGVDVVRGSPLDSGSWGLARSARAEVPGLPLRCFDENERSSYGDHALPVLQATDDSGGEWETAMHRGRRLVPRLERLGGDAGLLALVEGTHVVTGGNGGLGLLTGRWLAWRGAQRLVLASRNGTLANDASVEWRAVCSRQAAVSLERGDTSEFAHIRRLLAPAVAGVWHAAGVLADALLPKQSADALCRVYAPKTHGACSLHDAAVVAKVGSFALFSSVAALLGGAGQANYSAANSCLDAIATCRRAHSLTGVSVQWGPWAEVGMAARGAASERMAAMEAASGFRRISSAQGLAALQMAVMPSGSATVSIMLTQWSRLLGEAVPPFFSVVALCRDSALGQIRSCSPAVAVAGPACVDVTLESVLEMVQRTAGDAIDADAPLLEAGIDSLGAVELRNQLQRAVGTGLSLPSTLVFDHQTARQLALALQPDGAGQRMSAAHEPAASSHRLQEVRPAIDSRTRRSVIGLDAEQICTGLTCLRRASVGMAVFCVPNANGHAHAFRGLSKVCDNPMYALIHPHNQTGSDVRAASLEVFLDDWSTAILQEVGMAILHCGDFALIGGSTGGLFAHQTALAAHKRGLSPRRVFLLDPLPPTRPLSKRVMSGGPRYVAELLIRSANEEALEAADIPFDIPAHVTDAELGVFVAARLAELGREVFTFAAVLERQRELATTIHLMSLGDVFCSSPQAARLERHTGEVCLVTASGREAFYMGYCGLTRQESCIETARLYGDVVEELAVPGTHVAVVTGGMTGGVDEFNECFRRLLHGPSDSSSSSI